MKYILPSLLRSLRTHSTQVRYFNYSPIVRKDEKSKQVLKNLGLSLQKGNINSDESDSQEPPSETKDVNEDEPAEKPKQAKAKPKKSQAPNIKLRPVSVQDKKAILEAESLENSEATLHSKQPDARNEGEMSRMNEGEISRMNDLYDTISHMSTNDLTIQKNFDDGRQFFSYQSEHYLDRKAIIRELPEEIDILNPKDMERLDGIYLDLDKLDHDKSVQLKHLRSNKKYDDQVTNLIQEFNGISKKFRLLRRNELDMFHLGKDFRLFNANLSNLPYNVVGFDKSISGFPLRSGSSAMLEAQFPQEFVEDLQMFKTVIPIHKRDLDIVENDVSTCNVDPRKVQWFKDQQAKIAGTKGDAMDKINQMYDAIFESPKNTITVDSIDAYNSLTLNKDIVIRIENEILIMRKSLQNEVETCVKTPVSSNILLYRNQSIQNNQYRLCETSSKTSPESDSLIIVNYHLKEFNLIPNYAHILNTVRQRKNLRNHLYKLFLLNIEEEIDTLIRIKYFKSYDMNKFMKKLVKNIGHVIKFKLTKLFKPLQTLADVAAQEYDALIFNPYTNKSRNFKRIYWLHNEFDHRNPGLTKNASMRRRGINANWKKFDELIDY